jgi:hypothetical protein
MIDDDKYIRIDDEPTEANEDAIEALEQRETYLEDTLARILHELRLQQSGNVDAKDPYAPVMRTGKEL